MSRHASSLQAPSCDHSHLSFTASSHADEIGYCRPTAQQRATAAGKNKNKINDSDSDYNFPPPLVLPGDDLSFDPRCPPQSLRSWVRQKERNEVTSRKNVLYVAGPPEAAAGAGFVRKWSTPQSPGKPREENIEQPQVQDVIDYLAAFYHGMQVKLLPPELLRFSKWDGSGSKNSKSKPGFVGLNSATESLRIRVRPSLDGVFQGQLNLDDLLEMAISNLPGDAYALLMLVEHDLFEDEDDDFCCGRAYGGSRVAVVSMARYNPFLDESQNVEREHAWPASHCEAYVKAWCDGTSEPVKKKIKKDRKQAAIANPSLFATDAPPASESPLQAAMTSHTSLYAFYSSMPHPSSTFLSGLWLSRLCQTASHELGHCFGMAHCVYYACAMQSTSSLTEDVRQPPYLCPVDLAKVLRATGADERGRYAAMSEFCGVHKGVVMFGALGAWIGSRLQAMEKDGQLSTLETGSRQSLPIEL